MQKISTRIKYILKGHSFTTSKDYCGSVKENSLYNFRRRLIAYQKAGLLFAKRKLLGVSTLAGF